MRKTLFFCMSMIFFISAELYAVERVSFAEEGGKLDNFIVRSFDRIAEAWLKCGAEFQMALRSITDKTANSQRDIEARSRLAGEELANKAEKIVDDTIENAKERIKTSAREVIAGEEKTTEETPEQ